MLVRLGGLSAGLGTMPRASLLRPLAVNPTRTPQTHKHKPTQETTTPLHPPLPPGPTHSRSDVSTLLTRTPALGTTRDSSRLVPPYRSSPATTWSPADSSRVTAASAAMPLLKANARSAPCG